MDLNASTTSINKQSISDDDNDPNNESALNDTTLD